METYRLVFLDDGLGEEQAVEFEAYDAPKALIVSHALAKTRSAELWKGDERLCTIRRPKAAPASAAAPFVAERAMPREALPLAS